MPPGRQPVGRREPNKQEKLERTIAARDLFDTYSVDAVTTQQITDRADNALIAIRPIIECIS